MATIVQKDPAKRRKEDAKREAADALILAKEKYINRLKMSPDFQNFVLKPVIDKMNDMADIRNFPSGSSEEMEKLTYNVRIALDIVEEFIKPFRK